MNGVQAKSSFCFYHRHFVLPCTTNNNGSCFSERLSSVSAVSDGMGKTFACSVNSAWIISFANNQQTTDNQRKFVPIGVFELIFSKKQMAEVSAEAAVRGIVITSWYMPAGAESRRFMTSNKTSISIPISEPEFLWEMMEIRQTFTIFPDSGLTGIHRAHGSTGWCFLTVVGGVCVTKSASNAWNVRTICATPRLL